MLQRYTSRSVYFLRWVITQQRSKLVWVEKQYVVNQADDESFRLLRRVPGFSNLEPSFGKLPHLVTCAILYVVNCYKKRTL